METLKALTDYYEKYSEDGRLRSRHGSVEFLTTMRYIERYLKPGMRIMEIGAGTGRYSHALALQGYHVDAVELVEHNIEIFKQNTAKDEPVTITQGNATDLSTFPDNTYDMTLLLGPMYHLYTETEQHQALSEAIRITQKGGIIFAAYCNNDATIIQFCFQRGMIKNPHFQELLDPVTFKASSTPQELFQLYRKEDIDRLMADFAVTRLHYLGTDMATNFIKETVDAMDDEVFEIYMRYHFYICEREDMVGATHHILDVFRKD
ncbi:MAG: class I SAM-dependent methyltransferase [Lachnospiraceae bacterium]|nr:class I SAM-dependent methyltransferase [Lachnospiraceae bacterium]